MFVYNQTGSWNYTIRITLKRTKLTGNKHGKIVIDQIKDFWQTGKQRNQYIKSYII